MRTHHWIDALRTRAAIAGAFVTVIHKGDAQSGAVLVIVRDGQAQNYLYSPAMNMEGARVWLGSGPYNDSDVSERVNKRRRCDDDLWVVEIEDRAGRHYLTEPVEMQK